MSESLIANIAIVGLGYVGCAMATLLSQHSNVVGFDINKEKIKLLRNKVSPIKDDELTNFLKSGNLNLDFKQVTEFEAKRFDTILISTPTNFDEQTENFDTHSVEQIIAQSLKQNLKVNIVIKSTIPIGFTKKMREKYQTNNIYFCPEFLREGKALYDNLFPNRIIFGGQSEFADCFVKKLQECSHNNCDQILITSDPTEAECIKLFSNTYIAMRVAFFNELDSFCMHKKLNSMDIINGIGLDKRIGNHYNNPSFGFGGYCLPKDSKQARTELSEIPCPIISAINDSNNQRMKFIADHILISLRTFIQIPLRYLIRFLTILVF